MGELIIVSRAQWRARPPVRRIAAAPVARLGLVVHHAVTPEWTGQVAAQRVQNIHLGKGWADVGYTFLVDMDGVIYEGRALNVVGGHTRGHNTTRHAVCLIGTFTTRRPSQAAVAAVQRLYHGGAARGWWRAAS